MAKIDQVKTQTEAGKTKSVPDLVREALEEGSSAKDILQAMIDAMAVVGDRFSAGEIFIPEMLIAAKAMSLGVEVLKPHLAGDASISLGTCVIGTVEGDLHDIGKNLVSLMIGSAGFDMVDLGANVSTAKFIEAIKGNEHVKLVACSGLLTTTMSAMKETVTTIKSSGLTGLKVIVGGAPITPEFAREIGADAYAIDAGAAAKKAKELLV
jgi:methanogenic corrinoid protein MtbC1